MSPYRELAVSSPPPSRGIVSRVLGIFPHLRCLFEGHDWPLGTVAESPFEGDSRKRVVGPCLRCGCSEVAESCREGYHDYVFERRELDEWGDEDRKYYRCRNCGKGASCFASLPLPDPPYDWRPPGGKFAEFFCYIGLCGMIQVGNSRRHLDPGVMYCSSCGKVKKIPAPGASGGRA